MGIAAAESREPATLRRVPASSRGASWTAVVVPVAIALGVVAAVALVAGAPDDTRDLADPAHLGPRLVILAMTHDLDLSRVRRAGELQDLGEHTRVVEGDQAVEGIGHDEFPG